MEEREESVAVSPFWPPNPLLIISLCLAPVFSGYLEVGIGRDAGVTGPLV